MMKNLLKAMAMLFLVFILPIMIVSFCTKLDPAIRDYEETSFCSIEFMMPVECGLRD